MATEQEIREILKNNPPSNKFVPYCYVSEQADALTVYFEGDADYSVRLNDHITLYRSLATKEVVGCRVKGIAGILRDIPNYIKVMGGNGDIELALIFFAFRGGAEKDVAEAVNDLAREAADKQISLQMSI